MALTTETPQMPEPRSSMVTKLHAAELAGRAGIDTYVICGRDPHDIYRLMDGESVGTHFAAGKKE